MRVQEQLLECIEKEGYYPHSTSDLALKLGYSWHTVQQYCFELLLKGKIDRLLIGGSHIWIKKESFSANGSGNGSQFGNGSGHAKDILKSQLLDRKTTEQQIAEKLDTALNTLLDQEIAKALEEMKSRVNGHNDPQRRRATVQKKVQQKEESIYGRKQ